jgi:hypothetical protein
MLLCTLHIVDLKGIIQVRSQHFVMHNIFKIRYFKIIYFDLLKYVCVRLINGKYTYAEWKADHKLFFIFAKIV